MAPAVLEAQVINQVGECSIPPAVAAASGREAPPAWERTEYK